MDYVILALHQKPDFAATQRLSTAIIHLGSLGVPGILAHPTNRKIGVRASSVVEWDVIFELCVKHNIALEINGQPDRIDLPENLIRQAHRAGCRFVVSSDLHSKKASQMKTLQENAVWQARRGGLSRHDVINASTPALKAWLGNRYSKIFSESK
jgi:DNA polymerase (family 10)